MHAAMRRIRNALTDRYLHYVSGRVVLGTCSGRATLPLHSDHFDGLYTQSRLGIVAWGKAVGIAYGGAGMGSSTANTRYNSRLPCVPVYL